MKKLSLLGAALLSSSLLLKACSKEEPKKEDTSNSSQEKKEEKTTTQAYNFTVMDKDGKEVKLSDFKGKKVYINVWASWCGPCLREIPELEKVYQKVFKNQNPSDKSKDVILAKAKELNLTYPVLFDVNDRFLINYGIRSFPSHVFINSDGTIANRFPGALTEEKLIKELEKMK